MDRKRLSHLCALPLALALLPGVARAQAPEHSDASPVELPADAPLDLSTPEPDAGKLMPSNPFACTPAASDWAGRVGIDYVMSSSSAAFFGENFAGTVSVFVGASGTAKAPLTNAAFGCG